ncbi:aconitase X [Rhizobium sp. UGM030330-04]|uniref:cis-3-hydroxy-L-proline dehydratase n=1 Tax=Rhizobium sp. UGM030330-04 TaxID=1378077 RepID=UPI000D93AB78|nr:aconitase X [Rhizobium sp. UGM030330-04]PYG57482.1 putative aconitase subunit 1 /predicted aconitase subunit 2 [Rhizobium sp. UGM030330-04]
MSSSVSPITTPQARSILAGAAEGKVIATTEALSFWGGVDPATGKVIDVHHPLHGICLTGGVLFMPTSRGSCTGSGVLLDLILTGRAPAALVFCEAEDVLTLGALVAAEMFDRALPVVRLDADNFARFARAAHVSINESTIEADGISLAIAPPATAHLDLKDEDGAMLEGSDGIAARQAMRIIVAMAAQQGASTLVDVTQGHIDGCIYASPANLTFAEKMADMGGKVRVPTTMNAISVDKAHWRAQGVPEDFGDPAARLADAYVRMGCRPTFTCSPYLLDSAPSAGESIGWAESNAVIFANTVLGARTAKHPDFLDLCIAMTGRAPLSGVYLEENRRPQRIVDVALPAGIDDAFWPLVGYLAGKAAPDCIPLLRGLGAAKPSRDDLKALCAAFGTTSASPMLHIEGVTPEAGLAPLETAGTVTISLADMAAGWSLLNEGPEEVQLVAIGSPHASLEECRALAAVFNGRKRHADVAVIVTAGQQVIDAAMQDGTLQSLKDSGVQVLPDLCWCSISEPVFPTKTRALMTNSGKYAHYGPGLSGRAVRFGSLADCVDSALTGRAVSRLPVWLS